MADRESSDDEPLDTNGERSDESDFKFDVGPVGENGVFHDDGGSALAPVDPLDREWIENLFDSDSDSEDFEGFQSHWVTAADSMSARHPPAFTGLLGRGEAVRSTPPTSLQLADYFFRK